MDKNKQNLLLIILAVCMLFSMVPQLYRLWQILQLPLQQMFSLPDFWNRLGLLLLIPSLFIALVLTLPQIEIANRDVYQKSLTFNFIAAGILQLFAAWQAFSISGIQAGFYILLAIFGFTAPSLIKQIRTRLGI